LRYQSTTGLSYDLTEELVARIAQVTPARRRGRRPVMGLFRSVQLTLALVRHNVTQAFAADMFGISQPTVSRIVRRILPLIGQVLCVHVPPVPEVLRGRLVLIDGTLIPTGNRAGHKENYSGKHRRQGLSVQILSDTDGRLLAVSPPCPGRTNDRKALTLTGWEDQLTDTVLLGDLGYRGTHVIMPARRAHGGGEHSEGDKASNREISAIRSAVERAIAHLKHWKILATGYRGRLTELPTVIRIITALEFYRQGW
jgi:hypothetical protein